MEEALAILAAAGQALGLDFSVPWKDLGPRAREVALHGGGKYAAIDTAGTISISTPWDEELARLGGALNDTYLAYGRAEAGSDWNTWHVMDVATGKILADELNKTLHHVLSRDRVHAAVDQADRAAGLAQAGDPSLPVGAPI